MSRCASDHPPFHRYIGLILLPSLPPCSVDVFAIWDCFAIFAFYRTLRADGSRNDLGVRLALLCSPTCAGVPLLCFRILAPEAGISNETWAIMGSFQIAENGHRGLLRALSQLLRTCLPSSAKFSHASESPALYCAWA